MKYSPSTVAIHGINLTIGMLSVAILGLVAHSISLTDGVLSDLLPANIKGTGRSFLFWPACGGIVDMLLFWFLWSRIQRLSSRGSEDGTTVVAKKTRWLWNGLVFVAAFMLGRPLITLIYTFVEHDRASKNETGSSSGYVTPETWACAARSSGQATGTAEKLCSELRAARYLVVPEVILGALILGLVIWRRFGLSRGTIVAEDGKA